MNRNLVSAEQAELNREREGALTFNAEVPDEYEGTLFVVAALRLGEHAHLDVHSGRQWKRPAPRADLPRRSTARAGTLILPWQQWCDLRDQLAASEAPVVVREVENPSRGNLEQHVP